MKTLIPFSFFWKRVTDEWLVSKTASILFGAAAFIIALLTAILVTGAPKGEVAPAVRFAFGILGVLGAFGIFFLWQGMWKFWARRDPSSESVRRITFVVLIVGVWYGAILYFLLVYLPAVSRAGFGRGRFDESV